jgi:hypothetical protein
MLLALLAPAFAAPLSPVGMQQSPLSFEVAGTFNADRVWLKAPSSLCTQSDDSSCHSVRMEVMQGGQLDIRPVKWLGVYASAAHMHEANSSVIYTGTGWTVAGGLKLTIPLGTSFGVDAWAEGRAARTWTGTEGTSDFQVSRRIVGEVGADVHVGSPDDDIIGWVGAGIAPYSDDHTLILDNSVDLALIPAIPVSAEAGFLIVSSPLGGPWMERGRLGAGVSGSAGYRSGLTMWLSGSF